MKYENTRKYEHITRFKVTFLVNFTILMFVFKPLHGTALPYIADLIHKSKRLLIYHMQKLLHVPRSKLKFRGECDFEVAAPRLWNTLLYYYGVIS